jgi:protein-tyrosine-phosphatase
MAQPHYNVLFLCTGNSARSTMAEAILNSKGRTTFTAYSAGSHPSGTVRPEALRQLKVANIPTNSLRSKPWDEFSRPDAPQLNFVFTVCDNAAKEVCPVWPGQPMTAHWGIPDPSGGARHHRAGGARLPRCFLHAGPANQPVSQPSARQPRPACAQAGNRQDRPAMNFNLRTRTIADFMGTADCLSMACLRTRGSPGKTQLFQAFSLHAITSSYSNFFPHLRV